jgi:hypothetical protein
MALSINKLMDYVFKIWRPRRFKLFRSTLEPKMTDRLLDVGGYPGFWMPYEPVVASIDTLNLDLKDIDLTDYPNHHFNPMVGNGCALPFPDQSYDIGFSNSVIEHVGSWENQQAFASEIRRVGKALWVQTPAKECPIEPHYIAPFVHWLPKGVQRRILRYFSPWGWIAKPTQEQIDEMVNTTRLITYSEMKGLFPDCEILVENYLWIIPKSYIAVRKSC